MTMENYDKNRTSSVSNSYKTPNVTILYLTLELTIISCSQKFDPKTFYDVTKV